MRNPFHRPTPETKMAAAVSDIRFPGQGGGRGSGNWSTIYGWPGDRYSWTDDDEAIDYEGRIGNVWENSAVAICLGWIMDNFVEPDLRVYEEALGIEQADRAHPLAQLIANPNPDYDGDDLWAATVLSYCLTGNAYWRVGFDDRGKPGWLYHTPPWMIRPTWPADGSEFIDGYEYTVDGVVYPLQKEEVVHFRFGLDPADERVGFRRLRAAYGDVFADNQVGDFAASVLDNMGVAAGVLSPASPEVEFTEQQGRDLKDSLTRQTKGRRRGSFAVLSHGVRLEKAGWSPEEMAIDKLGQRPEGRIAASFRTPAMVVGLAVGEHQRTYANMGEAREAAWEECLIPIGKTLARCGGRKLLRYYSDPARFRMGWDYSKIRALQADQDKLFERWTKVWVRRGCDRFEYRMKIGLEPRAEDKGVYYDGSAGSMEAAVGADSPGDRQALKALYADRGERWWESYAGNGNGKH